MSKIVKETLRLFWNENLTLEEAEEIILKQSPERVSVDAVVSVQELGEELEGKCKELVRMGGLRFVGTSWGDIKTVLVEYGYKDEPKF